MTSSRRGFFATLAALPAVLQGAVAIAASASASDWHPRTAKAALWEPLPDGFGWRCVQGGVIGETCDLRLTSRP